MARRGRKPGSGVPDVAKKYQWKKGQSGNPLGSNAHSPETKAIRMLKKLTIESYREMIELALSSNLSQLKKIAQDPEAPALRVGIAVALVKAIQRGDGDALEKFATRIVGKIPDELNVTQTTVVAEVDQKKLAEAMKALRENV